MRILVASLYFHPDHSGIALYSSDLAFYLAEQGHQVTALTGVPFYPTFRKRAEDRRLLLRTEQVRGVRFLRGYLWVPRRVTTRSRIFSELSFLCFALLNFCRAGRHERIIVLSPPILLGVLGLLFRGLWRSKLVFHVQDLQVAAAVKLGMFRGSLIARVVGAAERLLLRRSDRIVAISDGMRELLARGGAPPAKIAVFPNWIDVAAASRPGRRGEFRAAHPALADRFLVAYAGTLGVKQGLDVLLDLAAATRDEPSIHYLLVGGGADGPRLAAEAQRRALANLTLLPLLRPDEYRQLLDDIDVSFLSQRSGTGSEFFPSKVLGILARGRPLLISADDDAEVAAVVKAAGIGRVAAYGDLDGLRRAVLELRRSPDERDALGRKGRAWVEQYDRERVLAAFAADLAALP